MKQVYKTIIQQALMSLENLQALNEKDMELIDEIDCPELLITCAQQLQKLAKKLEPYRSHDLVGTFTQIGMIAGVRKDGHYKIQQYKICNKNGTSWITAEQFNNAMKNQRIIDSITISAK